QPDPHPGTGAQAGRPHPLRPGTAGGGGGAAGAPAYRLLRPAGECGEAGRALRVHPRGGPVGSPADGGPGRHPPRPPDRGAPERRALRDRTAGRKLHPASAGTGGPLTCGVWRGGTCGVRRPAACLVTASAVALVVLSTLLFFGLAEAMKNGMFQVLTERAGHLVVTRAGADEAREFDAHLIREAARVEAALREVAGEGELAVLLEVPVLASGGSRSRGIQLVGLRQTPGLERQFAQDYLSAGRLPDPDSLDEIVLGEALARALR